MENLSHTVSKTAYNGNGFGAKSVYDDVFGGPPKFGVPTLSPRTEDYAEIFGGFHASRASSIPILDLPAADEADDYSYDIRSSHCVYSEVFGGFSGLDFAISFEELTNQSKTTYDSSDEAWTPAQSETLSDESELSACSERYQSMSNVESFESCDGIKQLKVSYNKAGHKKDDLSNGVAHVTQLHDVPGYSFIINETPPSRKTDARNTPLHVNDDLKPNADSSGKPGEGKRLRKTVSCINRPFVTVSDINLRTRPSQLPPPSRAPPVVGVKNEDFDVPSSKLKACKTFAFGESSGHNSPPFYDVQIDASSSAAVSAAAMKHAMEKAQAKLKSAKELKERNKEGLQSHKISVLKDHENDEVKASKKIHGSNCFTDEQVHETSERDFCGVKIYAGEEKQKLTKREEGVSSSIDGEHINVARLPKGKVHVRECGPFQESIKTEGIVAWRQDEEFYEVVETDESREIFNVEDNRRFVVHNLWSHEHGQQKIATPQQEEDNRKMKSDSEIHEWDGNKWRLKESKQLSRHDEHEKKVKVNEEVCRQKESGKQSKMAQEQGDVEKIITETVKGEAFKYMAEVQQKENGVVVEKKLKEVTGRTEDHKRYNYDFGEEENEKKLKGTLERERYEKRLKEATERAKTEKRLKEALERREKENKEVEACERKEKEKGMKEVHEREQDEIKFRAIIEEKETEKKLTLALEQEENEEKQNLASKRDEAEERLTEDLRRQEMEVKPKGTLQKEENALKQKEAHRRENNVERPTVSFERRENEKKLKEGWEQEENMQQSQEAPEKEEHEKSKIDFEQEEIDKKCEEANEFEANKRPMGYSDCLEALKERSNDHEHNERKVKSVKEGNFGVSDGACKLVNDYENLESGQAANMEDMNSVEAKKIEGDFSLEKDRTIMGQHIGCEVQVERSNLSGMVRDDSQPGKNQIGMKDANESLHRDDTGTELDEDGIGQSMDISKKPSNVSPSPGNPNIVDHELGERDTNLKKGLVGIEKEEREVKFMPSQVVKQLPEDGGKMRADQPTVLDNKRNVQSTSQKVSTNQNTERKGKNLNNILTQEEREKEERINRERELENDRLRKIEEEREREREREKDRMAVDIAFLEARDRAAVERATSEVRQRALAEARERLEKASMEARLRAERAAVERATAEARERAFQKAKAEKASAEARERVERTRQSSLRTEPCQGVGSANGSIYSYSSGHSGVEGESPQRCKARLERHQRTAERAAKALAEKNMRDFVAQREQAERNRLAEGLDAEVKRWSGGKEGNLRALLSTLQYILGPDSGWHPIPLTEVITSAAVKKAYRKATLCVHPDKLQQRGASIHQKYICEKVFDLLKEAWNKFNSEER